MRSRCPRNDCGAPNGAPQSQCSRLLVTAQQLGESWPLFRFQFFFAEWVCFRVFGLDDWVIPSPGDPISSLASELDPLFIRVIWLRLVILNVISISSKRQWRPLKGRHCHSVADSQSPRTADIRPRKFPCT